MLDDFAHFVIRTELFGVQPNPLAHQEREVAHTFPRLHFKTFQELIPHELEHVVKLSIEGAKIAVTLNGETRKVNRSKAEITALPDLRLVGVVVVRRDTRTTTHVADFRLGVTFTVECHIVRRILEGEVREETRRADFASELEEVVVRVAFLEVHTLLHAENLNGEDRGLTITQTCLRREEEVLHHHVPLRGDVRTVINGGEGCLSTGARVH